MWPEFGRKLQKYFVYFLRSFHEKNVLYLISKYKQYDVIRQNHEMAESMSRCLQFLLIQ